MICLAIEYYVMTDKLQNSYTTSCRKILLPSLYSFLKLEEAEQTNRKSSEASSLVTWENQRDPSGPVVSREELIPFKGPFMLYN